MAQNIEDIISDIKSSYKKSNLQNVNIEGMPQDLAVKIGYLLQKIPNESNKEYTINFDPLENVFLQKLIKENTLNKRIIITKEDYFKGIIFLDYLTNIILEGNKILDDFYEIALELEKIDPFLDPNLELLVKYSGMYYLSNFAKKYVTKNDGKKNLQKYNTENKTCTQEYTPLKKVDPLYETLGTKICNLIKDETVKQELKNIKGLNDLKSLIFTDTILEHSTNDKLKTQTIQKIKKREYYNASLIAITGISKEVSTQSIQEYMQSMNKNERN